MKINIGDFIYIMDKRENTVLVKGNVTKIEIETRTEEDSSITKVLLDTGYEITILSDDP